MTTTTRSLKSTTSVHDHNDPLVEDNHFVHDHNDAFVDRIDIVDEKIVRSKKFFERLACRRQQTE